MIIKKKSGNNISKECFSVCSLDLDIFSGYYREVNDWGKVEHIPVFDWFLYLDFVIIFICNFLCNMVRRIKIRKYRYFSHGWIVLKHKYPFYSITRDRINPFYPLFVTKDEQMGRIRPHKPKVLCNRRFSTSKIPSCSETLSTKQRPINSIWVTYPNNCNINSGSFKVCKWFIWLNWIYVFWMKNTVLSFKSNLTC